MFNALNRTKRPSTAVPAQVPFVPAAIPGADKHWKKAATRKAKSAQQAKASAKTGEHVRTHKSQGRISEYDEKFEEWELPENNMVAQDRKYAPTGFYERDINAFDWKSEQRRSFVQKDGYTGGDMGNKIAGTTKPPHDHIPASFAWDAENPNVECTKYATQIFYC
jgi:hypothetical protein